MGTKDALVAEVRAYLADHPVLPEDVSRAIVERLDAHSEEDVRALRDALAEDGRMRAAAVSKNADELETQLRRVREENDRILSLFERLLAQARLGA